ncbi:Pre-mRNA-splicing factor cef1 [Tulasnella sp. JGI-2019a]|nr:Pre-mRNA-splicing factor cef1 [Tulasnella sp. JGI-2019a]
MELDASQLYELLLTCDFCTGWKVLYFLTFTTLLLLARLTTSFLRYSWKNSEDEVLKAAIAKYGKNQWARISSLLVRKTPKQCKARWYEWLDPSIKKTEWSKTEDEKLLHLAKLMPTQWRTIAPIVGRTATQCLERYQKLLDEAEAKESRELGLGGPEGPEGQPSADDIRRLRPGEIDPDPETKPARPDPIDMDEDEKEMLSEARARLANTQGKKAKRKARERQLEEARRLAVLQKKRELKAAGIIMRSKPKKRGMDYNADIPFEKQPVPGFYDVSEENAQSQAAPIGQTLRRLDNKRKPEEEAAEAKKRARKAQEGKEGGGPAQTKFVAAREAQIQKLKEAEQIGKRRTLVLPAAQVGEAELEEIVKIGQAGENARASLMKEGGGEGNEASAQLFGEYGGLGHAVTTRTPRTAPQEDNIHAEVLALRDMTQTQTPLLGEANTPMHSDAQGRTGFEGATPRHQVAFTPNPLATPLRGKGGHFDPSATPGAGGVGMTPLRTPVRDNLSINADGTQSVIGDTPREQRMHENAAKRSLKLGFASLPKPKNEFELDIDSMAPTVEDEEEDGATMTEEDAAERDARNRRRKEEAERKALARRSLVVQRGLPRPVDVDVARLLADLSTVSEDDPELTAARKLVDAEVVHLIEHDTIAHPLPGTRHAGGTESAYEHPDDEAFATAKSIIHSELAAALGFPGAHEDQVKRGIILMARDEEVGGDDWATMRKAMAFDPTTRIWVEASSLSSEERAKGLAVLLEQNRERMADEAAKASKTEKRLGKLLGGYQVRWQTLSKRLTDSFEEMNKTQIDLESFSALSIAESAAAPRRIQGLSEEVDRLERREVALQERYQELDSKRRVIKGRLAAREEMIMAEAESINEQALAEEMAAEVNPELS